MYADNWNIRSICCSDISSILPPTTGYSPCKCYRNANRPANKPAKCFNKTISEFTTLVAAWMHLLHGRHRSHTSTSSNDDRKTISILDSSGHKRKHKWPHSIPSNWPSFLWPQNPHAEHKSKSLFSSLVATEWSCFAQTDDVCFVCIWHLTTSAMSSFRMWNDSDSSMFEFRAIGGWAKCQFRVESSRKWWIFDVPHKQRSGCHCRLH